MRDYDAIKEALTFYAATAETTRKTRALLDAADAIEELLATVRSVVHCKDCKWCHVGYCEKYDDLIPWGCANKPWEDWFCADGKRREAKKEAQDAD